MEHQLLIGLGSILVLGTAAQWLAWKLRLPSILLLLATGLAVGPLTGFIDPDAVFGDLLFPIVSLSVAVILFEGGLSLNLRELREDGEVIWRVLIVGALVTWGLSGAAAWLVLGFSPGLAALIGAILIVTGPTVVIPLLMHIRPVGRIGSVARWEGIVNDPIGAIVAVLVFEALLAGTNNAGGVAIAGLVRAVAGGTACGLAAAFVLVVALSRYWVPDILEEPVTLTATIAAFVAANMIQPESGLLAVTIMGIALANQQSASIDHIIEFKERLRTILIAGLFVLLAARLSIADVMQVNAGSVLFLAFLVLIARPAAIFLATIGTNTTRRERFFLAWMAPRGIVAAAVASLFGLQLAHRGVPGAEALMPQVFFVIVGTVLIYGLTAGPLARALKLADPSPQGLLIVGAHDWAREIAAAVQGAGFGVVLVDTNRQNVAAAKLAGLQAINDSAVSNHVTEAVGLHSIGRLLALTPNHAANSLAAVHFGSIFGRAAVYQLGDAQAATKKTASDRAGLRGRTAFSASVSYSWLRSRFGDGAVVKTVRLTEQYGMDAFRERYGESALPLFVVSDADRTLTPYSVDAPPTPRAGQRLIAIVDDKDDAAPAPA